MIRCLLFCALVSSPLMWAADAKNKFHEYFQDACQTKHFMGAASITINGDTIFTEACGWADAEWKIENTVDTRFRTGSIGKQFTAAGVLLLHEDGKLSLSDPVGKYLPDLPESWCSATIHQLLTHTSGLPIPSYTGPAWERYNVLGVPPGDYLDLVRDKPLLYPHGTKLTYSNTGYMVLGMLIEKLSGSKYENFIQERLFNRLGMQDSGFDDLHKIVARRARGYVLPGAELQNAELIDARTAWSAGGFYSTVHDLTLWSEALAHGKLLNPDSTKQMFAIYPETELNSMHYGYGVVLAERFGHKLQYHAGGIIGFNSVLQRYPEAGMVIVVFSNGGGGGGKSLVSWILGDGLAKLWFDSQSH